MSFAPASSIVSSAIRSARGTELVPSPPPETGALFERGKLYLSTHHGTAIVQGWPRAEAYQRTATAADWSPFEPAFPLVRPYRPRKRKRPTPRRDQSDQLALPLDLASASESSRPMRTAESQRLTRAQLRQRAFDAFRFSMPKPVAAVLEPVRHQQWLLLRLLTAGSEEMLELAQSNPALAFCLAARCRRWKLAAPHSAARLRNLARCKRPELLGWLGFPATAGAGRTLARIDPASLSVETIVALRNTLAQPGVAKRLAHLPRLNAGVLAIAADPRLLAAATPPLLAEVAATPRERHYPFSAELLADTLDMVDPLRPRRTPRQFATLARLRDHHDRLAVEWCRRERHRIEACRFPRPPVPGTPNIVPIRTPRELIEEGERQHHCVATYAARVQARSTYIYRVLRPQRATLAIVPGPGGAWRRGTLLGAHNGAVGAETRDAIDAWLEGFSI